jgi:exodeoxyribonuclease VIII
MTPAANAPRFAPNPGVAGVAALEEHMPCNQIMIDLETLSLRKDAAIIQLAAVAFDPETGELGAAFNAYIRDPSGHVDAQTVAWWMQQAHAPKIGAAVASAESVAEIGALLAFASWLDAVAQRLDAPDGGPGVVAMWSHGATFDVVVLENAYSRCGRAGGKPWSYKIERDTRTLYALAPGGMPVITDLDETRKHDAAYDCEIQVRQVVGALAALRGDAVAPTQRVTGDDAPDSRSFISGNV